MHFYTSKNEKSSTFEEIFKILPMNVHNLSTNSKKTLVIGASENPERYSNKAVKMLHEYRHEVVALGKEKDKNINGLPIVNAVENSEKFDTITLYLNPKNQEPYYEQIIELKPRRVIFNPGTENPAFEETLKQHNIEPIEACTLVMLRTNQF